MKSGKKHKALDDMKTRILTLDMRPGTALDEAALCEAYDLSRTPLRELFQQLAGEGYVTLAPSRGATVASMDLAVMRTFFQTAPMIYASVARLAAENRTESQLSDLQNAQQDFRAALDAGAASEAAMSNHQFHEIIGEMAGNAYLTPSLKRLLVDHTRMSPTFYNSDTMAEKKRIAKASRQHDAMITAIQKHEAARAVTLTLEHWDLSRDQIEKYVQPDPLPVPETMTLGETKRHAV